MLLSGVFNLSPIYPKAEYWNLDLVTRLPIQHRRSLGIPRDERVCTVCHSDEVGDEFHYLLNCSNENVKRNRVKYVDKLILYTSSQRARIM